MRVSGIKALDYITELSPSKNDRYSFSSRDYGYCCDMGSWENESRERDYEDLLWNVILFTGAVVEEKRDFVIEFTPTEYGNVDWDYPVTFIIQDLEQGEHSDYEYTITRKES